MDHDSAFGPDTVHGGVDTVRVPWSVIPDYRCFGCSPHNTTGLRLRFTPHPDGLQARFRLGREFESYPGVVHGGLIGVICDEVMGNLIVLARHHPAFTVTQRTRFLTPLLVGREYHCVATLSGAEDDRPIQASAEIRDADGLVCASSTAAYQPFALDDVRHQLTLGDDEVAALSHALSTGTALAPNGVHP
ncbi:PaaI family thioesterase [Nocardia abscessus]|uniref:PaaI family thioesterase n=1 Tax=Nocardia abscessus TaxID=120957 RepID=UPI0002ED5EA2|nr:PaaI family thioesterase [Nocardia abscessus]MCC3332796.1 PaaI family thioesterase [Nocardia abscessus]